MAETIHEEAVPLPIPEEVCILCKTPYPFGFLCEGRCAFCWSRIAADQKRMHEAADSCMEARGKGYMADAVYNGYTFDSVSIPGLTDLCPYDNQTHPGEVAWWNIGFQHRTAERQRDAAREENERLRAEVARLSGRGEEAQPCA